jgi:hypothetical protein
MILTTHNGSKVRLYAGLYMRTKRQTRFWGWGWGGGARKRWASKGWASLRAAEADVAGPERPWAALAEWLRLAHARLDRNALAEPAPAKLDKQDSLAE